MTNVEQVIEHLRSYISFRFEDENGSVTMQDIITLLEKGIPRLMTLSEIEAYLRSGKKDNPPFWLEWRSSGVLSGWAFSGTLADLMRRYSEKYNKHWRPWTSKPSDKQREAIPWNS